MVIEGCIIEGSRDYGVSVRNYGVADMYQNTIRYNGHGVASFSNAITYLDYNIIVENDNYGVNCQNAIVVADNNDVWGNRNDWGGCASPKMPKAGTNISADPLFKDGGPALVAGSPCIDIDGMGTDMGAIDFAPSGFAPSNLNASAPPGEEGKLDVTWSGTSNGYKLYYGLESGVYTGIDAVEGPSPIDVGNVTNYQLTGLADTTYYLSVGGYDTSGAETSVSTEKPVAAIDTTAPGHPTDFQAYGSDGEVVLEWTNPTDIDFKETVVLRKSAGVGPLTTQTGLKSIAVTRPNTPIPMYRTVRNTLTVRLRLMEATTRPRTLQHKIQRIQKT